MMIAERVWVAEASVLVIGRLCHVGRRRNGAGGGPIGRAADSPGPDLPVRLIVDRGTVFRGIERCAFEALEINRSFATCTEFGHASPARRRLAHRIGEHALCWRRHCSYSVGH